jgi:hypothetical protein
MWRGLQVVFRSSMALQNGTDPTESLANTAEPAYPESEIAILFFGVALILGAICKQVFARTPVPYTVALLIIGIILGTIGELLSHYPLGMRSVQFFCVACGPPKRGNVIMGESDRL